MTENKIYFLCPDHNLPAGGIKKIYHQVDLLNNNGFNAYILHKEQEFKCDWFNNETPVRYNRTVFNLLEQKMGVKYDRKTRLKNIGRKGLELFSKNNEEVLTSNDILVFPEIYGPYIHEVKPEIKKVIFNQNFFYTFENYGLKKGNSTPYLSPNVIATIVASEEAVNYINHTFPEMPVYRIWYGIDSGIFNYTPNKKKQIAYMPRKLREDLEQVINILYFKNALKGWELIEMDSMNEEEVASSLKESAFFLSFNYREGFGLPPAEAMACGCIVAGYHGIGGKEFFEKTLAYPIEERDVRSYVLTMEHLLNNYEENFDQYQIMGKRASDFILSNYSLKKEEESVVKAWKEIFVKNFNTSSVNNYGS